MSGPAPGIAPRPAHRHEKALRWLALTMILGVLAAAFVLPLININRYQRMVADTIARSLGHPVHLGSVKLQLLPRPGLAISDFVVDENADFGAEPLLRAPAVTVSVRLASLWRAHLEVSRIDLDEASVNLVHNNGGQWNFASLLEQASRMSNAPTAQRRSSSTPRFPYIQFKSARINFKSGNEKKGFSFENADLSIWLDNPKQWRLRFEAQPARTDLDLEQEDTGLMRVEGSLDRAPDLTEMPVKLHAEWIRAEMGQASRMLFDDDLGWRGDLRAEADIAGTLRDLHLTTRLRVADVHRAEFSPLTPLDLDMRCAAQYRHDTESLDPLTCLWPVGEGHLLLTGSLQNALHPHSRLTLEINQTPAALATRLLGLLRARLPSDLSVQGVVNGSFQYATDETPKFSGHATVQPLTVSFTDGGLPFVLPVAEFSTAVPPPPPARGRKKSAAHTASVAPAQNIAPSNAILLAPSAINIGAPFPASNAVASPLQISGHFTSQDFSLHLTGAIPTARLKQLSSAFGSLRTVFGHFSPQGNANLDLVFSSPWIAEPLSSASSLGSAPLSIVPSAIPSAIRGWVHLQSAEARLDWLPAPLEIASASAGFDGGRVRLSNISASVNNIAIRGSADAALRCDAPAICPAHFNLEFGELDAAALQSALMGAGRRGELLQTILAEVARKNAPWPAMDGQATIGALNLRTLVLQNVHASIGVEDHRIQIQSLDAATLGGTLHATGTVDATGSQPQYVLEANWSGVNVPQMASLFDEKWPVAGAMAGGAHLVFRGYSTGDLAASTQGTFHWLWNSGSLIAPEDMPADAGTTNGSLSPAHFRQWSASGAIQNSTLTLNKASLANPVSGAITFDRRLDLAWPRASGPGTIHIGGTLVHPIVEAAAEAATLHR